MIRLLSLLTLLPLSVALAQSTTAVATPDSGPAEEILQPPEPGRFRGLFQRFRTEHAALSPDGRHLAYSVREEETTSVVTIDLAHPEAIKARVKVIDDNAATPMLAQNQREQTPGRILALRWVTANRVVVETNEVHVRTVGTEGNWASWTGSVLAFDADGGDARRLASPSDLVEFTQDKGGPKGFSTARPRRPETIAGALRPDLSAEEAAAEEAEANGLALPALETAESTITPVDTMSLSPRSLRFFDLDRKRPGSVTLVSQGGSRGNGMHWLGLFSLDAQSAKLTNLTDELVRDTETALLDRQGRLRLSVPNTVRLNFPFRYEYLGEKGRDRGKALDSIIGSKGFTVSPENYFGERAIPLGFDEDPNILYYASNSGRDTYGLYGFNLATQKSGSITLENPAYDLIGAPGAGFPEADILVFDRFTHKLAGLRFQATHRTTAWLRPELQAVQAELEQALPGRSVEILEWDETVRRFLVCTEGPADPGAFYIYDAPEKTLREFVRRAPWVDSNHAYATIPFGFALPGGTRLTGFVTVPLKPRLKPVPMIVLCPEQPWARVLPGFQRDVHALAGMGFAVVQLNGRGAWGLGRKQREAITAGYDLVQVEDLAIVVKALAQRFQVNPKRVALMGRGHGGFIALRALQDHPDLFRCAIALEPPVDLGDWLGNLKWTDDDVQPHLTRAWLGDEARFKAAPLTSHPEAITKPVLLLSYPGLDGAQRRPIYLSARRFAEAVRKHGATVEFDDLRTDYVEGLPAARAEVFDRIEGFLNEHIYDYKVKLRDLQIIPDPKP